MNHKIKCYLHIGTEKTGSTSIQKFFAKNRDNLLKQGIIYPKSLGKINHINIPAYALPDIEINDSIRCQAFDRENEHDLEKFRDKITKNFHKEVKNSNIKKLIISNEHCHSRLTNTDSLIKLKSLINIITDDIEIIVYIRRQDRLSVSSYSTALRAGYIGDKPNLPSINKKGNYQSSFYDYKSMIERFQNVFGLNSINIRIFESDKLHDNDVVKDISSLIGIDQLPTFIKVNKENEALSYKAQRFLLFFNQYSINWKNIRKRDIIRTRLVDYLCELNGYKFELITKEEAISFVKQYEKSNEWIREQYFPNNLTLFNEDYAMYDNYSNEKLTFEDAVYIFTNFQKDNHFQIT